MLVPGSTVELAVLDVTSTADATSLVSEVDITEDEEALLMEDEEAMSVEDEENKPELPVDTGTSATLVLVEVRRVVLCLCLCP